MATDLKIFTDSNKSYCTLLLEIKLELDECCEHLLLHVVLSTKAYKYKQVKDKVKERNQNET